MSSLEKLNGWESLSPELRERLAAADLPESLRFGYGTDAWGGEFCLDPDTGAVQVIDDNQSRTFVNSSLELYARSLRLVAGLAPAIVGGDPDSWEDAKNEMQRVIRPGAVTVSTSALPAEVSSAVRSSSRRWLDTKSSAR